MLLQYYFTSQTWNETTGDLFPHQRTDHSTILVDDLLYVFGGRVVDNLSNDLWKYNITAQTWTRITAPSAFSFVLFVRLFCCCRCWCCLLCLFLFFFCFCLSQSFLTLDPTNPVFGHRGVYVPDTRQLFYFGGITSVRAVNSNVYVFNLDQETWQTVPFYGDTVVGLAYPVVVYDQPSRRIIIHGGTWTDGGGAYTSDILLSYSVATSYFTILNPTGAVPPGTYNHAAAMIGDYMVIHGGATDSCLTSALYAYHLRCNKWVALNPLFVPLAIHPVRYAHSLAVRDNQLYAFGGFNGIFRSDIETLIVDQCWWYSTEAGCLAHSDSCAWFTTTNPAFCTEIFVTETSGVIPFTLDTTNCSYCPDIVNSLDCSAQGGCDWCYSSGTCLDQRELWPSGQTSTTAAGATTTTNPATTGSTAAGATATNPATTTDSATTSSDTTGATTTDSLSSTDLLPTTTTTTTTTTTASPPTTTSARKRFLLPLTPTNSSICASVDPCNTFNSCGSCNASPSCKWCAGQQTCVSLTTTVNGCTGAKTVACFDPCSLNSTCATCVQTPGCGWCECEYFFVLFCFLLVFCLFACFLVWLFTISPPRLKDLHRSINVPLCL